MTTAFYVLKAVGISEDEYTSGEHTNGDLYIVADWNNLSRRLGDMKERKLESILRSKGFDTAFEDQLANCDDCGKFTDLQPGYYGDVHIAQIFDDCLLCPECAISDHEQYLEDKLNNPKQANTLLEQADLEALGFVLAVPELENGFYGSNDDPEKVFAAIKKPDNDVLFSITGIGQFNVQFEAYIRHKD